MADICNECIHLDWSNKERYSSADKYYCNELRKYVEPRDRACRYFSRNGGHNNSNNSGWRPSGFSWMVGEFGKMLGLNGNPVFIESMNYFKANIYDNEESFVHSQNMLHNFFIPMLDNIFEGDLESAKLTFKNFVEELKEKFGFIQMVQLTENNLVAQEISRIRLKKVSEF